VLAWLDNPVTKAQKERLELDIEQGKERLIALSGSEPLQAAFISGAINALRAAYNVEDLMESEDA